MVTTSPSADWAAWNEERARFTRKHAIDIAFRRARRHRATVAPIDAALSPSADADSMSSRVMRLFEGRLMSELVELVQVLGEATESDLSEVRNAAVKRGPETLADN